MVESGLVCKNTNILQFINYPYTKLIKFIIRQIKPNSFL
jgi:hypothetical protein